MTQLCRAGYHHRGLALSSRGVLFGRGEAHIGGGTGRTEGAGGAMLVPFDGGGEPVNVAPGPRKVEGVVADDHAVYWIDNGEGHMASRPWP